jgi:hypothetical protein
MVIVLMTDVVMGKRVAVEGAIEGRRWEWER